jgi:hypothetical protein
VVWEFFFVVAKLIFEVTRSTPWGIDAVTECEAVGARHGGGLRDQP